MKRIFDIIVSIFLLIILTPVFCYISWRIINDLGRPIFFFQTRIGMDEKKFKMIKFRSMKDISINGKQLDDSARLTAFGSKLRESSLDELPELLNVLKGDMSLVGPRPLLVEYLPLYNKMQRKRHNVKPGITGWAQVNGRNAISWTDKFNFDVDYVKNQSILFDIKILLLTVKTVIYRENISEKGEATSSPFTGNKKDLNSE